MNTIQVWPTKKSAVTLKHPHGPVMTGDGALWPMDSFTARRLTDGSVSRDEKDAYKEPAEAADPAPSAVTSSSKATDPASVPSKSLSAGSISST